MSTEQTGTEVFEDVDPDPDAVLDEFGVESPADLADGDGAHDPVPADDAVDDTTAAELFADLEAAAAAESVADVSTAASSTGDESLPEFEEFEAAFVGEPGVTVRADDDLVESTAADLNAVAERVVDAGGVTDVEGEHSDVGEDDSADGRDALDWSDDALEDGDESHDSGRTLTVSDGATDGLELVGPDPTTTRIRNDAFDPTGAGEY